MSFWDKIPSPGVLPVTPGTDAAAFAAAMNATHPPKDPTALWKRANGYRLNPAKNEWELDTPAVVPPVPVNPPPKPLVSTPALDSTNFNNGQKDNSILLPDSCGVYFRDIKKHLIRHIEAARYVVGCAAWLTDFDTLDALARRNGVAIVVHKRESYGSNGSVPYIREKYARLPRAAPGCDALRCLGGTESGGLWRSTDTVKPWMHNKFLLFSNDLNKPYGVWTGSYNFTRNSCNSFENAVYFTDPQAVEAYTNEWKLIWTLAQPLVW